MERSKTERKNWQGLRVAKGVRRRGGMERWGKFQAARGGSINVLRGERADFSQEQ